MSEFKKGDILLSASNEIICILGVTTESYVLYPDFEYDFSFIETNCIMYTSVFCD